MSDRVAPSSLVSGAPARFWCLILLVLPWVTACQNRGLPSAETIAASLDEPEPEAELDHVGPRVELAEAGPARFVRLVYNAFRAERALEVVAFLDERYRTAGSKGYEESLDELERRLREAGFGSRPALQLEILETPLAAPSWTGKSASLTMTTPRGGEALLHSFSSELERDRCMLPEFAPSCEVSGVVALGLDELSEGEVLVTEAAPRPDLLLRAKRAGAVALVSAALEGYNQDPADRDRHLDAVGYQSLEPGTDLPVAMISPRSYALISDTRERAGEVSLSLTAEVERGASTTRTLVATIVGATRPQETVVLPSHILAPGASDNASGAAGMLEGAITLARILERRGLDWPSRSLSFVWGPELSESSVWLETTSLVPVASVHAVMIGNSRERTGAVPRLERTPDPGAVRTIPPDQHSLWGAREVQPEWLVPSGLSLIARCALVDVARHAEGWETFENPFEGGTDHELFVARGVPAVLFWHFTDFTFHTSLDRYAMVDGEELHRMAVATLATAMAVADPKPTDLDRYLKSMVRARQVRVAAARDAGEPEVAEQWEAWYFGVRQWLREQCLSLEPSAAQAPVEEQSQ
jgi:aminopeptidase YwaD